MADGLSERARPPYLAAQLQRLEALVEAAGKNPDEIAVEAGLQAAADGFRVLRYPYWVARCELELASWLREHGDPERVRELLDDSAAALERLGAAPALIRVEAERGAGARRGAVPGRSRGAG